MTFPNRDNESFPDIEQEKRAQARQASAYAAGEADELPAFASKGPDAVVRDGEYDPEVGVVLNDAPAKNEAPAKPTEPEPPAQPAEPAATPAAPAEPETVPNDDPSGTAGDGDQV